jgi:hypothetical protein
MQLQFKFDIYGKNPINQRKFIKINKNIDMIT